ncbi:hypothetical protein FGB62_31g135 [Gracilaria domingensis]|nr:hypothetical protein FGB62_31g135 [Gracilaria domingensis]
MHSSLPQRARPISSSTQPQNAYPYGVYAPSQQHARHSRYSTSRGCMPVDYVNAQATATAAVATVAVYCTNWLHINGHPNSGFSSLNTNLIGLHHGRNSAVSSKRDGRKSTTANTASESISRTMNVITEHVSNRGGNREDATFTTGNSSIKLSLFNDVVGRAEKFRGTKCVLY